MSSGDPGEDSVVPRIEVRQTGAGHLQPSAACPANTCYFVQVHSCLLHNMHFRCSTFTQNLSLKTPCKNYDLSIHVSVIGSHERQTLGRVFCNPSEDG